MCSPLLKLKQLFTICFTVQTTCMKEKSFWTTSKLSFVTIVNKITVLLVIFFSLVVAHLMTLQIRSFEGGPGPEKLSKN